MQNTTNYNLKKFEDSDNADLPSLCENFDIIDGALTPTVDQATAPPTTNQKEKLAVVLGWIAFMIKAITGKANWWVAPAKTLQDLYDHITSGGHAWGNITDKPITFNPSSHIHDNATGSVAGFMSAADKAKLDGANFEYPFAVPMPWLSNIIPNANCIFLEGQAISRTTYAAFFAIIGTTFGAGDGSTTFNVPNLKGKVIVGYDSAQTEFDTLGETGGAKTHTLTIAEMPSHTHTLDTYSNDSYGIGIDVAGAIGEGDKTTSATGGNLAHNNLQPYITLRYICKAK